MVEENISSEEVEIIEEKKKCKKKKKLMEEGMKYCATCGAEYSEELEVCPSCESTETFSKCESIDLRIAKKEAILTAGSSENEATLTTEINALKTRKEEECTEEIPQSTENAIEESKQDNSVILVKEPSVCPECNTEYDSSKEDECSTCQNTKEVVESKEDKNKAIAKVETIIKNIEDILNQGQEAQAKGEQPPLGFEDAQEQLRKTLKTLEVMKTKVDTNLAESKEVIVEADVLVVTDTTAEETELAYFKSLSGQ
jgi:hypothetical protein